MRVLLLGGTGAMGVSLKDILAERGDEVYITSRSQHKDYGMIHYLQGDAHEDNFMVDLLKKKYDTIVDFMFYSSSEFSKKAERLLAATGQYIFVSSSRVYADSRTPITEDSPRLLDICKDIDYLNSDEYALAKAREENILFESKRKNWTIIRPYITYNVDRLQLGVFEKDIWLYRALHGRSIPLPKDIATHQTTMTYGGDVAKAIAALIGNKRANGEVFHLTGVEHMLWADVLKIYCKVLREKTGRQPLVYAPDDSAELSKIMSNREQVIYDRLYDRVFDNTKLLSTIGTDFEFKTMKSGLSICLSEFMKSPKWIGGVNFRLEAYLNRQYNEKMENKEFTNISDKVKYFGWYHAPGIMTALKSMK